MKLDASVVAFACLLLSASTVTGTVCGNSCLFGFYCAQGLTCSNGICSGTACEASAQSSQVPLPKGEPFAFDGEAGKVYNFITEQEHQVNAKFAEKSAGGVVLVESMGMKLHDTQVEISADEQGEMQVRIDGKPVELLQDNGFQMGHQTDKVNITVHKYRENLGNTAHLITNLYNMLVVAVPAGWNEDLKDNLRGHLKLVMAVEPSEYAASEVEGLIGGKSLQNVNAANVQGPAREEYEVSHLFADNFKHNLYGLAGSTKALKARRSLLNSTRRRLGETQVADPVWLSLPQL